MNKNRIRLTESQLRRIIMESINEYAGYDSVKQAYGEQGDRPYDLHLKRVCGWNGDNGYEKNDYFKDHGRTPEESQKMHDRKSRNKQNLDPLRLKQAKMANSQLQEVSLKGKSGKTYSLHGNRGRDWATMSNLRFLNPKNSPNHTCSKHNYNWGKDEDNFLNMTGKRSKAMTDTMPIAKDIADNMKESKLHRVIKESVKKVLKEVRGWSLEPDDFVIIGGNIDPNKTYELIKISNGNGLVTPYVVEYDEYFPSMLYEIYNEVGVNDTFRSMDDYYKYVQEIMEEDGCDEDMAESYASDCWLPCFDYDFAVYAPYGISESKPMNGAEIRKRIDSTAEDNWLKH